jgi:dynein heavy chain
LAKYFGEPDEKNNPIDEPLIFTSFISEHLGQDSLYLESTVQVLKKVLDEKMDEYNEIKARMNLVLFK